MSSLRSMEILCTAKGSAFIGGRELPINLYITDCLTIDGNGTVARSSCSLWIEDGRGSQP